MSNKTLDQCGVCNGNNTCLGCDGVPNSGKQLDRCGVCGGNGQSCIGCDLVLYSNKTIDGCGVCGGDNTTCGGCDHVPYSSTYFEAGTSLQIRIRDPNFICLPFTFCIRA
jgi:hypothetical protein